jgi:hypothetical protein
MMNGRGESDRSVGYSWRRTSCARRRFRGRGAGGHRPQDRRGRRSMQALRPRTSNTRPRRQDRAARRRRNRDRRHRARGPQGDSPPEAQAGRARGPGRINGHTRSAREEVDEIVCLSPQSNLYAIGLWYEDFRPVEDEQVVAILDGAWGSAEEGKESVERPVRIPTAEVELQGDLTLTAGARGIVLFAHGSGSSRKSRRNRFVAGVSQRAGLATLLFDLRTVDEERADAVDAHLRFDIDLLARRRAARPARARQSFSSQRDARACPGCRPACRHVPEDEIGVT